MAEKGTKESLSKASLGSEGHASGAAEKPAARKEKIDLKKMIIYSEIMKPKFED